MTLQQLGGLIPAACQSNAVIVIVPCPVPQRLPLRNRPFRDRPRSAALAPSRSREPILPSGISFNSPVSCGNNPFGDKDIPYHAILCFDVLKAVVNS